MNLWRRIKKLSLGTSILVLTALLGASASAAVGTINASGVNIRKQGSTNATVLTTLQKGAKVEIADESDGWYQVKSGDVTGYVRSDMVSKSAEEAKTMYAIKDQVNLRGKASTTGTVVTTLKQNEKLSVLGTSNYWYQVKTESGKEGYVRKDMLTSTAPSSSVKTLAATSTSSTVTTTSLSTAAQTNVDNGFDENEEELEIYFEEQTRKEQAAKASEQEMQEMLKKLNFFSGEADGKFGPISISALKAFQTAYGVTADGEIGEETLLAAQTAVANGGNGSSAGKVKVSPNGVVLTEWFNYMKDAFPKYESLRCVDVETGEEFKLRAFSAGNHADVEPPTKEDTEKLYRINGNKWGWEPRAIWVYIDGVAYAAAINVQPHGPDTLPNNGMDGQICMHFLYSRSHNKGIENDSMQKAVWKAFEASSQAPAVKATDRALPLDLEQE